MPYRIVNGRNVFIVDDHHQVMAAWADVRCKSTDPPYLISFDSHTDSFPAFMRYLKLSYDSPGLPQASQHLVQAVKYSDPASISQAIRMLAHDEHIDCAIRANIIDRAFVFLGALSEGYKNEKITVFHDYCVQSCTKDIHDDDCLRRLADHFLEPELLGDRIKRLEADIGCSIERIRYILDIDLDVFLTRQGACPHDPSLFRKLIRNAQLITIAREPSCVAGLRLEGEEITANILENIIIDHIQNA